MGIVYMYDSVSLGNIPSWAQIVASYVDGHYANFQQALADFPHAYHVSITVLGTPGARVCDCENGDLTPQQAAAWAHNEVLAGRRPTIYSNISSHPDVVTALAAYNLEFVRDVDWWAAGYTNTPYLAPGSVVTQFSGGMTAPYDISDTNGVWPTPQVVTPPPVQIPTCVGMALGSGGYWLANSKGNVAAHGVTSWGQITTPLNAPLAGIAPHPSGNGYWLVGSDGGVFGFGASKFHGSPSNTKLAKPVVGMAPSPSGNGYWLVASDGGIFSYGDAAFHGSAGGVKLTQPVVGMAATPTGKGYWLVASDGGIFAYGDAQFHGSLGNIKLAKPIVGIASHGNGYWLVGADGGVFSFSEGYYGSTGNIKLAQPVVGITPSSSGHGYGLVAADGGVFAYGDYEFKGAGG
jgi:hypothetical protein